MRKLLQHAATMGVSVHAARLEPGVLGEWYADEREIYFDLRLSPIEQVCTVAHELGHAYYDHRCDQDPSAEDQADEYAARLLVDPERYAVLERQGFHLHDIAEELGVTVDLLHVYMQRCLVKLRGVTYARARMGVRMWAHRQAFA